MPRKSTAQAAPVVTAAEEQRDLTEVATTVAAREIPLALIEDNPDNPRTTFDDDEQAELNASVADRGVLQPIRVRPIDGDRFRVVMGSRRFRAATAAGLATIPAVVRQLTDDEAFDEAVVENLQRADMNAMDTARSYARIRDRYLAKNPKASAKEAKDHVAKVVGKTVRTIELRLQYVDELPEIKQLELAKGKISAAEATKWLRDRPKPLDLTAAEWLLALEVYDAVQVRPLGTSYPGDRQAEVRAEARFENDGPAIKRLSQYPTQLVGIVSHVLDEDGNETGRFAITAAWDAKRQLELKFGDLSTPSARDHALDGLKQELGLHRLTPEYATAWLNGPFEIDPLVAKEVEQKNRERRERIAAQEAERKADADRQKAERDTVIAKQGAVLDAVMSLDADAPTLDETAFRERFRAAWATAGVEGPWRITARGDAQDPVTIVDGAGSENRARGAELEARRRLIVIALNFAAGLPATAGPLFRTPWSPNAPILVTETVLSREEFVRIIAGELHESLDDLPDDEAEALFEATARAGRGLDLWLSEEGIEYGDPGFRWNEDAAWALADEIMRLLAEEYADKPPGEGGEGGGALAADPPIAQAEDETEPSEVPSDDENEEETEDAAPADADAEIPGFLLRLAGGGEAEASANG